MTPQNANSIAGGTLQQTLWGGAIAFGLTVAAGGLTLLISPENRLTRELYLVVPVVGAATGGILSVVSKRKVNPQVNAHQGVEFVGIDPVNYEQQVEIVTQVLWDDVQQSLLLKRAAAGYPITPEDIQQAYLGSTRAGLRSAPSNPSGAPNDIPNPSPQTSSAIEIDPPISDISDDAIDQWANADIPNSGIREIENKPCDHTADSSSVPAPSVSTSSVSTSSVSTSSVSTSSVPAPQRRSLLGSRNSIPDYTPRSAALGTHSRRSVGSSGELSGSVWDS